MNEYFPTIGKIAFEGLGSKNPLAFKVYNGDEMVAGKSMREHLRFSVAYWHTMKGSGADPFGGPSLIRPWDTAADPVEAAEDTMRAAFEFVSKLGVDYWCFHDRDISPEGDSLQESNRRLDRIVALAKQLQADSGIKLLWNTSNMFSHRRFANGAATNPDAAVYAYAGAQVSFGPPTVDEVDENERVVDHDPGQGHHPEHGEHGQIETHEHVAEDRADQPEGDG